MTYEQVFGCVEGDAVYIPSHCIATCGTDSTSTAIVRYQSKPLNRGKQLKCRPLIYGYTPVTSVLHKYMKGGQPVKVMYGASFVTTLSSISHIVEYYDLSPPWTYEKGDNAYSCITCTGLRDVDAFHAKHLHVYISEGREYTVVSNDRPIILLQVSGAQYISIAPASAPDQLLHHPLRSGNLSS